MKFKESQTVELKASVSQLSRAMESLCAFANTDLGTIYFGVRDDGTPVGIEITERTFQKVQRTIFNSIDRRLYPNIYEDIADGKPILVVELKNAPDRPYFYNGKAWKRVGTSNATLSRGEIELLLYERENPDFHYDRTVLDVDPNELDKERIEWFLSKAHEERNLPLDDSTNAAEKLNISSEGKPNVSGLLAFGKDISRLFPTAFIKCAVFEGKDKTGRMLDHLDIKEDVFRQIDQAENFVLRNIRKSAEVSLETGRRESRYEVPYRAIREAIANAVAHRDYRISSTIDVAIFDDRIEVWSPGTLPIGMTMDLLHKPHASLLRNGTLAELLYLTRYIERWGSGIENMKAWMGEYGLLEPELSEVGAHFLVVLRRPEIELARVISPQVPSKYPASTQQVITILQYCLEAKPRAGIQRKLGLKDREHFRTAILGPVLEDGLVEMTIPDKPHSPRQGYITTEKGRKLLKDLTSK